MSLRRQSVASPHLAQLTLAVCRSHNGAQALVDWQSTEEIPFDVIRLFSMRVKQTLIRNGAAAIAVSLGLCFPPPPQWSLVVVLLKLFLYF